MPWGPLVRLSLWYKVEEAEDNCHKTQQKKDKHAQEDHTSDVILQGGEEGKGEEGQSSGREEGERGKGQLLVSMLTPVKREALPVHLIIINTPVV